MVATLSAEVLRAFEHLPDLYLVLSPELEILTASNAYLENAFLKREAVLNRSILEVFAGKRTTSESETMANLEASLRRVLSTKKPHQISRQHYELFRQDGTQTEQYLLTLNYPVLDEQGAISYIIHKVENVTEQAKTDIILDTIDGAFMQLDDAYRFRYVNQKAQTLLGKKEAELAGKNIWEEFPQAVGSSGYHAIIKAFTQQVKVETEFYSVIFDKWVYQSVKPINSGILVFYYDRQDIKETQLRLQKSETLLREAEKVAKTGSYEADLLTNTFYFSDGMYRLFGEEPNSFTPTLDFIDSRSNPEDAAKVREILNQAAADKKPYFYTRRIRHKDGSWRTVESHGRVITNAAGEAVKFMGTVQDVTERKKAEKALKQSEEEYRLFVTASSEVVYKMSPNWKEMYFLEGKNFLQQTPDSLDNWKLNHIPPVDEKRVSEAIAHAIETKSVFELEHRVYKADGTIGWTHSRAFPMVDKKGEIIAWIGAASDITERKNAEKELKENKAFIEEITHSTPDLITIHDAESNQVIYANDNNFWQGGFDPEAIYQLGDLKRAEFMIHPEDLPKAQDYLRERNQLADGKIKEVELRVIGKVEWIRIRSKVFKRNKTGQASQIISFTSDITARKKADQALQEKQEQFEAAINVSPVALGFLKSVRNEKDEITDFNFYWVSSSGKALAERDITSLNLIQEYPILQYSALLKKLITTVEANIPTDSEEHYHTEHVNIWFRLKAVKLDDGLFVSLEDITSHKMVEQELVKNLALLKQSEEVASIESWEYVLENGTLSWSEGMYQLFDLPYSSPVSLDTYFEFAVPEDQENVANLIKQIVEPDEPIEETIRIKVNGTRYTLRIKAIVIRDEQNKPTRVLGVDLDISEVVKLEQENLDLRLAQQKALLLAILEAQEEERARISESLHNGVGQLLYATKINLSHVAEMVPKKALKPVEDLLSEAISETRRVSHELVPLILQDFGIVEGIADLCRRFHSSSLRLNCRVINLPNRLEKHLEVAIYRICQELINNVVNHAKASEAKLTLEREGPEMLLHVEDNGKGLENNNRKTGIGFRLITDRIKLLNGSINISTPETGKGTLIAIRLPIEQ